MEARWGRARPKGRGRGGGLTTWLAPFKGRRAYSYVKLTLLPRYLPPPHPLSPHFVPLFPSHIRTSRFSRPRVPPLPVSEYPYLKQVNHPVDPGLDVGKLGDLREAPLGDPPAVCEGRREPERLHVPGRGKAERRKAGRQDGKKTRGRESTRMRRRRRRG